MKHTMNTLALAAIMAVYANAQVTTVTNNPADTGVVTSYFSICPTSTVTLSTTTTICPGPNCGGTTTVFYSANPITTVGPDGRTTIYEEFPYTAPCPCDGGVCDAVYTVTRECPCNAPHEPTVVPAGFATSAMACHACAKNGGPSTVTVVTPAPNGPYASQTPVMGAPYNGASASAGASAYASAGPNGAVASSGATAAANAGNGYASAAADANASAKAGSSDVQASSDANSNAQAGDNYAAPPPSPVYTPGSNSTGISPPIASYTGSANRAIYAFSAIAAGVAGCLAFL